MLKEAGKDLALEVESLINGATEQELKAAAQLCTTTMHRTLQQKLMRFVVAYVLAQGKQVRSDLRNEATVKLCKELTPVIGETALPYI